MRLLNFASFVVAAIAASAAGIILPGPIAGTLGYVVGVCMFGGYISASKSVRRVAPWEPDPDLVGLTLSVVRMRDHSWRPEYVHRPHMLSPHTAVTMLRQAAAQIEDDWK